MAYTESNMMPLGSIAPAFRLPDTVTDQWLELDQLVGEQATVIIFLCNHCPYVIHVNPQIVQIANDYRQRGVNFIGISSNDVEKYPDDAPDKMKEHAQQTGYPFPYLYDESQAVAKAYDAACTPDFYVFDREKRLYYRGRIDGSRPKNDLPLTGADLRDALDKLLAGTAAPEKQYPSGGCNIKWKPGNEPS
jgi:peroxiredoxin